MSFQLRPAKTRKSSDARDASLQGGTLVLVAMALGLFVASIPSYLASLHILSKMPASDAGVQLSRQDVQQLRDASLSIDFYAWYNAVLNCLFALCYGLAGVVIFLRKPENRVALFASLTLVMFSIDQNSIYLSSPIERHQTKWVVFGTSLGLGSYLVGTLVVFALLRDVLNANIVLFITGYTLLNGLLLFFLISLGFAMLRSRLWNIDVLINRTLVYGTLTASLALIYAGLVITFQYFLRGFIGMTNNVAIVGSTLAIAALFQPMRRYIQAIIDRRFYRRKYDAAKTLEAFSPTLRKGGGPLAAS